MSAVRPAVLSAAIGPDELDLDEPVPDLDPDAAEIDRLVVEFNGPLWDILSRCPTLEMRRAVARAYLDFRNFPSSDAARDKWTSAVSAVERGAEYF